MIALVLKLLQNLVNALNSEGSPFQVAAGIAFGACLGLTPIANLHNVVVFLLVMILNVSMAGFWLGWALFVPVGFLLDPLFDAIGQALLGSAGLRPLWTSLTNMAVVPFTNFNNSVVLGSFVFWIVAFVPILLLARWGVAKYRSTLYERLKKTKLFQAVTASKLYAVYQMFWPT
jgi:uncharacterized protein (TIGR03546 family)